MFQNIKRNIVGMFPEYYKYVHHNIENVPKIYK